MLCGPLGRLWGPLGSFGEPLRVLWGAFGDPRGALWEPMGILRGPFADPLGPMGLLFRLRADFWDFPGNSGTPLGSILGSFFDVFSSFFQR